MPAQEDVEFAANDVLKLAFLAWSVYKLIRVSQARSNLARRIGSCLRAAVATIKTVSVKHAPMKISTPHSRCGERQIGLWLRTLRRQGQ